MIFSFIIGILAFVEFFISSKHFDNIVGIKNILNAIFIMLTAIFVLLLATYTRT